MSNSTASNIMVSLNGASMAVRASHRNQTAANIARAAAQGAQCGGMLVHDIREIAAHLASGRAPAIAFHAVSPPGHDSPRPARFVLGPASPENLWEIFAQTATPGAGCYVAPDAYVAPTGIAVCQGVAFHADAFLHPRHLVVAISDRLNAESPPVRHVPGQLAVIYGPAHETWGHWLIDFLPRLWVLRAAGYDLAALRYLLPSDLRPFARELLRLCGIADAQIETYDHWRELISTDELLLPAGLRATNRLAPCFAEATAFWTGLARQSAGAPPFAAPGRALYLARDAAPQGRLLQNRSVISAAAQAQGLQLVYPEKLSVAEQVALFSSASMFAGEYGSGLHNSVFAPAGAAVLALRSTSRHPDFVQTGIATALGQDVGYVFGITDGAGENQSFAVAPEVFVRGVELIWAGLGHKRKQAVLF